MATIWMLVTDDEYELPLVVADTAGILARRLGTTAANIYSLMSRDRAHGKRSKYVKVEVDDDELS